MYEQTLKQAGLREEQAIVYEAVLREGAATAGAIARVVPLKRGLVYKVLDELVALGVIERRAEESGPLQFVVLHPLTLKDVADKREQAAKDAKRALDGLMPNLISDFNLVSGQPGIQFFEGPEGVWEVLKDSLRAKREIYTYADIETIDKYARETNERYVKKRNALGLDKKVLVLDTPYAREKMKGFYKFVTDTRFLDLKTPFLQSVMEIYDDTVSYITFGENERMIGVIIHDPAIYTMHKALFEFAWEKSEKIGL